ncbi:MAG: Holliday junction branch migration protein RuvA [Peptococcaceae bacterium]|nr:Holliday junction branch migration protein RuvA [Peptococcaceae bacterium]
MIAHLKGKLAAISEDYVIVDVGGLGFKVNIYPSAFSKLPPVGQDVTLLTHLLVKEDGLELFGFTGEAERACFMRLLTVNGVGPRTALALVGLLGPEELWAAILREDAAVLAKAPGIGKKTAQRIIVELKDRLEKEQPEWNIGITNGQDASEVLAALLNLGYSRQEAQAALRGLEGYKGATTADLLKAALRKLGQV